MSAFPRAALSLILVLGALLGSAGCVYRPTIQQGNLLKTEDVDQVTAGMTRSQVRYLLGTPMIADPFDPQRWDYIYTLQRGREKHRDRAHFIVWFEGDKVSRVEKPGLAGQMPLDPKQPKTPAPAQPEAAAPVPPPAPAVEQPLPGSKPDGASN
jgi:outer membrane protein assembly factor BamE